MALFCLDVEKERWLVEPSVDGMDMATGTASVRWESNSLLSSSAAGGCSSEWRKSLQRSWKIVASVRNRVIDN